MRTSHLLKSVVLTAAIALGCSGPRNETGGSMAGTKGTATGEPEGAMGLCMFDRRDGQVRRCLNFGFGACKLYGDVCSEDEINTQREDIQRRTAAERAQK